MTKGTITPDAVAALRDLAAATQQARELDGRIFRLAIIASEGGVSFKTIGAAYTPRLSTPAFTFKVRRRGGWAGAP